MPLIRFSLRALVALFFVLCTENFAAFAQDYLAAPGKPTFATVDPAELGYVDLANGNLHLSIDFVSLPQRGIKGPAKLSYVYDSNAAWAKVPTSSGWTWSWSSGGPLGVWTFLGWRFGYPSTELFDFYCSDNSHCGNILVDGQTGTQRYFFYTGPRPTTTVYASDSSGFALTNPCNYTCLYVSAPDGTVIAGYGSTLGPWGPLDTNGNIIPSPSGNSTQQDTLGRTIYNINGAYSCGNCTFTVPNSQGGTSQYTINQTTIPVHTNFGESNVAEVTASLYVIPSIVLPDGSTYTFKYDCDSSTGNPACGSPAGQSGYYGLLVSMTLPTGGMIQYGWTTFTDAKGNKRRWLTSRSSSGASWQYSQSVVSSCVSGQTACQKVTRTAPDGTKRIITYAVNNGAWPVQDQAFDSGGTLLSTITNTFDFGQACLFSGCTGNAYIRLLKSQTAIPSSNGTLTNQTVYNYDSPQKGNVTAVQGWNYQLGSSFAAVPDRATYTVPLTIATNFGPTANRTQSVTTCNGTGTDSACVGGGSKVAQTVYTYDSYGSNCPGSGLQSIGAVNNYSSNLSIQPTQRGNPTTIQNWVSGTATVSTQLCYDTTGQVTAVFDGNGNKTQFSYADNFYTDSASTPNPPTSANPATPTNAYLTKVTPPITAPITFGYYLGSGKLASSVDANGADTYFHYVDFLDRPTHSFLPTTNGSRAWTLINYSTTTQMDSYSTVNGASPSTSCTSCQHSQQTLDTLGRPIQSALQTDPDGPTLTTISYDSAGRTRSVSNPYRTTSDPTYGSSTLSYDTAGRLNQLTEADGSTVKVYYGASVSSAGGISSPLCATATYGNGYPTLHVDEAGKKKQTWLDAFGRTIEVDEPNSAGTLALATCYAYDVLNNLTKVVQQGGTANQSQWRIRTFTYDGLSRLLSSTDPESGTSTLTYDANGNLLTKTSPAPNASRSGSPATGSVTVAGREQSMIQCLAPQTATSPSPSAAPQITCPTIYDFGTISITVNGFTKYVSYGKSSTSSSIATALAAAFNADSASPVTAAASGMVVTLTAKTNGSATNYSLSTSVSFDDGDFTNPSFSATPSGAALTGGTDPINQTVTVSYCYDALNRPTAKAYTFSPSTLPSCSGTPPTLPSPVATYLYDQAAFNGLTITNGIGRRTGMTDAAGSEAWSYDAQGNVLVDQRTTNGVTKTTYYTYNLDGSLATVKYPSGNTLAYTPGNAGQSTAAVDQTNAINYVTGAHYSPAGALAAVTNGTGISSTFVHNNRLQPCWIYVTTTTALPWSTTNCSGTATAGTLLDLKFNFGSANNGNVVSATNNRDNTRSQNFTYDTLNRLASAQTQTTGVTIPNANCWGLTFGYDPWNNLLNSTVSGPAGCGEPLPLSVSVGSTNRISGFCYDGGGNLLDQGACPSGAHAYTYNAENQLISAGGVNYTYDGDGRRVQKSNGKIYWYGMAASPLETTDLTGNANNATFGQYIFFGGARVARRDYQGNVVYYFSDHLGSSRVVASSAGVIQDDSDFYPFGGERSVSSSSGNPYKFTGYERDPESGLDYASARHYSSAFGRFTSPDPIIGSLENPQSWNRYSYVMNNPLNATDPSGMCSEDDGWTGCDDGIDPSTLPPPDFSLLFGIYGGMTYSGIDTSGYGGYLNYSYGPPLTPDSLLQTGGPFYPSDGSIMSQIMNDPALSANWTSTMRNADGFVTDLAVSTAVNVSLVTGVGEGIIGIRALQALHVFQIGLVAQEATQPLTSLAQRYPSNDGFMGPTSREFLYKDTLIDRYGGSNNSRFFSPRGTPAGARALPPETASQPLRTFRVVKPFEVQSGRTAPAFGQLGSGTQYEAPVPLSTLLRRGILMEIE